MVSACSGSATKDLPSDDILVYGDVVFEVTAGGGHTCALGPNEQVWCWGNNVFGGLGNGTFDDTPQPGPRALSGAVSVTAGSNHTCALLKDRGARCWGANDAGKLGDGTTTHRVRPVVVVGLSEATALSAGYFGNTCTLLMDGTVRCWGENQRGQLGDGTTVERHTPVAVSDLSDAVSISTGGAFSCAVLSDGTARCWGANHRGQLGDGTTIDRLTPVVVADLTDAVSISSGLEQTCALVSDGTARCWGANWAGQLGDGTTIDRLTPVTVSELSDAASIFTGWEHSCALIKDGTARCWGSNVVGSLGDGTTTDRPTPVAVSELTRAQSISLHGGLHTCAVLTDGTIHCWGYNRWGQLGNGTLSDSSVPVPVKLQHR